MRTKKNPAAQTAGERLKSKGSGVMNTKLNGEAQLANTAVDSDEVIANRLADYYLSFEPPWHLHILIERRAPCPLPFSHRRKNIVSYSTRDGEAARDWIVRAALLGFSVTHSLKATWPGTGMGTISEIRRRSQS